MAREKYRPEELYAVLRNPDLWVHWVDSIGEIHHTPRALQAFNPEEATIDYGSEFWG